MTGHNTSAEGEPEEIQLAGGVANAGAVTRRGDEVRRPSNPNTPSIHRFLGALAATGFDGASVPLGVDDEGRERLRFVEGDVPLVPYPAWARSDDALASVARLLRRFHDAAAQVPATEGDRWSDEMADPDGGEVVCHNDVCLENVVFRDGEAVALLDFDFAAPGRRTYDLACFARMCVPVDDESRFRFGWTAPDAELPDRLRLVADAYGLTAPERAEMVDALSGTIERGGAFLVRRMEAGDANFAEMWEQGGGMARFDRRRAWWAASRPAFDLAMR